MAQQSLRFIVLGSVVRVNELAYKTNLRCAAFTTTFMFICIFAIAPTFWGWWELGRPVSFSPVEIAKAFVAPSLETTGEGMSSNASASTVVKHHGDKNLAYGAIRRDSLAKRILGFASADAVSIPHRDETFG